MYTSILHWSFQICSHIHPKSFDAGLSVTSHSWIRTVYIFCPLVTGKEPWWEESGVSSLLPDELWLNHCHSGNQRNGILAYKYQYSVFSFLSHFPPTKWQETPCSSPSPAMGCLLVVQNLTNILCCYVRYKIIGHVELWWTLRYQTGLYGTCSPKNVMLHCLPWTYSSKSNDTSTTIVRSIVIQEFHAQLAILGLLFCVTCCFHL